MYKKILIIRTDRIGDVVLTTPLIKALRDNLAQSYIAMMVVPQTKDIVEGNPYLDEVIIYDKNDKDRGIKGFFNFVANLKKKNFDLVLVLHTKKRTNLIAYLSGIKERVGYCNNKFGFLLTKKIKDTRPEGDKHEIDYCLEVIRALGIEPKDRQLFMPLKKESEIWAEEILNKNKISAGDTLVALHPGASCPSKRWPAERFTDVAKKLIKDYGYKILVIASGSDVKTAQAMIKQIDYPLIDLSGQTSLSQLTSILKRCKLFISNDSGPVHIASSIGTPVISIFGRNQKGLSPTRWGPVGEKDKILHKEVGCIECLAHNCNKDFACLKAVTADDVLKAVEVILPLNK
jgi:heptosyltransferase-2